MYNYRIEPGIGGLERMVVSAGEGEAHIYRHGAHVTHFQPRGQQPVLWMSGLSLFEKGKPIRGGVPICFPWFGAKADDPAAPAHGAVRSRHWDLLSVDTLDNGSVRVSLAVDVDRFTVTHTVTVGRALTLRLDVYNGGKIPAEFEAALHTYLAVGDVRRVRIAGLENTAYIDKTDGMSRKQQSGEAIAITGETDRVYLNTEAPVEVRDPVMGRTITVDKTGSRSTVAWNPWIDKAKRMADFGDDEWPGMLCLETANVGENKVALPAGRMHSMTATLSVTSD